MKKRTLSISAAGPAAALAWVATLLPATAPAQTYFEGDTVAPFTLTERFTGRPVESTRFEGQVVLLQFFAHW